MCFTSTRIKGAIPDPIKKIVGYIGCTCNLRLGKQIMHISGVYDLDLMVSSRSVKDPVWKIQVDSD